MASLRITRQFGICAPDLREPLHTFTLWLSLFGVGSAVVWKFLRRSRIFAGGTVWLRLAALYGLLAFFAAPNRELLARKGHWVRLATLLVRYASPS